MPKKPKFKPIISRIKLNPEQAVLTCSCYSGVSGDDYPGPYSGCYSDPYTGEKAMGISSTESPSEPQS